MATIIYGPTWFFKLDSLFEFIEMIIALIVFINAYRIYKITCQKRYQYLALSFLFIGASLLVRSLTNLAVYTKFLEQNPKVLFTLIQTINDISSIYREGILLFTLLMLIGTLILTLLALKIKNKMSIILIFILSLIAIFLGQSTYVNFYLISSILFIFITIHFIRNWLDHKSLNTFMVFIAFLSLLIANIFFLATVKYQIAYFIGHALQMLGYIVLLIALIRILKK